MQALTSALGFGFWLSATSFSLFVLILALAGVLPSIDAEGEVCEPVGGERLSGGGKGSEGIRPVQEQKCG